MFVIRERFYAHPVVCKARLSEWMFSKYFLVVAGKWRWASLISVLLCCCCCFTRNHKILLLLVEFHRKASKSFTELCNCIRLCKILSWIAGCAVRWLQVLMKLAKFRERLCFCERCKHTYLLQYTVTRRLKTKILSENWVVRRCRRCANVIECTYTNLDSTVQPYYTPSLYGIA